MSENENWLNSMISLFRPFFLEKSIPGSKELSSKKSLFSLLEARGAIF